ncbi:MAG TPA: hypothetical protein DCR55_14300 [Lentisphaeria bacterium]|nr:hypothetical protein [Lentisphaeria bacterium]
MGDFSERLAYVGGAVAPLYFQNATFLNDARPTDDIDCVIDVVSYTQLGPVEEAMRELCFRMARSRKTPSAVGGAMA